MHQLSRFIFRIAIATDGCYRLSSACLSDGSLQMVNASHL